LSRGRDNSRDSGRVVDVAAVERPGTGLRVRQ